jgi:hypothetical protein
MPRSNTFELCASASVQYCGHVPGHSAATRASTGLWHKPPSTTETLSARHVQPQSGSPRTPPSGSAQTPRSGCSWYTSGGVGGLALITVPKSVGNTLRLQYLGHVTGQRRPAFRDSALDPHNPPTSVDNKRAYEAHMGASMHLGRQCCGHVPGQRLATLTKSEVPHNP